MAYQDIVNKINDDVRNKTQPYSISNIDVADILKQLLDFSNAARSSSPISITQDDFESDGVTYLNDFIDNNAKVFWSDLPNFLYESKGQWQYVTGGIKILMPGFNANTNQYNLEIFLN